MNRWKRLIPGIAIFCLSIAVLLLSSCSEDTVSVESETPWIEANLIICNPLSPSPGDLATLTVQAEGFGPLPKYNWEVEVGSLLTNEGISVSWQVPDTTGVFNVRVIASIDGSVDTARKSVMIRHFEEYDTDMNTSVHPNLMGPSQILFFIGSDVSPEALNFRGYHAYRSPGPGSAVRLTGCTDCGEGIEFVITENYILGSMIERYFSGFRQQLRNVWRFPLFFGTKINVSNDSDYNGKNQRRNQHRYPSGNGSGNMVVWQRNIVGTRPDGTADFFNIGFWSESGGRMTLTRSLDSTTTVIGPDTVTIYRYYRNIKPTFSPDERYVVYFVDTTSVFEPCLIPFNVGGMPDLSKRRALMVSAKIGIFSAVDIRVSERTVFQWNPDPAKNLLGFIDGREHLCFFQCDTLPLGSAWKMPELGKVSEFAWSHGGDTCAVATEDGISLVSLSGASNEVFTKEKSNDEIIGLNWSTDPDSNDPKLGFRLVRKGKSELDSYSALVIYSLNDDDWYYVSPRVPWGGELPVIYTWMRVVFEQDNKGLFASIPVVQAGAEAKIFHSFE